MQLPPSRPIPVAYSVLPTDAVLYYVQSVLRDTSTNKVLQTISLKQDPAYAYRYTGAFAAVSDPSGLGRPVDITTIVYTDAGHTVLSQNYAAEQTSHVVLQPWIPTLGAGGGGSIDYERLRREIALLVEEKLEAHHSSAPLPTPYPEMLDGLEERLKGHAEAREVTRDQESVKALREVLAEAGGAHAASLAALEARIGRLEGVLDAIGGSVGGISDGVRTELRAAFGDAVASLRRLASGHAADISRMGAEHLGEIRDAAREAAAHVRDRLGDPSPEGWPEAWPGGGELPAARRAASPVDVSSLL